MQVFSDTLSPDRVEIDMVRYANNIHFPNTADKRMRALLINSFISFFATIVHKDMNDFRAV